jgi:hypothetical protein
MPRRISSIFRRYFKVNYFLSFGLIVMRAYFFCRIYNFLYVIAPESFYYERYFRSHLKCELVFPNIKAERLFKEKERLAFEIAAVYAKTTRFRK